MLWKSVGPTPLLCDGLGLAARFFSHSDYTRQLTGSLLLVIQSCLISQHKLGDCFKIKCLVFLIGQTLLFESCTTQKLVDIWQSPRMWRQSWRSWKVQSSVTLRGWGKGLVPKLPHPLGYIQNSWMALYCRCPSSSWRCPSVRTPWVSWPPVSWVSRDLAILSVVTRTPWISWNFF